MNTPKIVDPEIMVAARHLRANGMDWRTIENQLGISRHIIRSRIDPSYRDYGNRQLGEAAPQPALQRITPAKAALALLRVPGDTRSMTAKICGDPLPGRSALDKRVPKFSPLLTSTTDVGGKVVRSVNGP